MGARRHGVGGVGGLHSGGRGAPRLARLRPGWVRKQRAVVAQRIDRGGRRAPSGRTRSTRAGLVESMGPSEIRMSFLASILSGTGLVSGRARGAAILIPTTVGCPT